MLVVHNFPADGTYDVQPQCRYRLGYIGELAQEHKVIFLIDGKQVSSASIGGPQDLKDADQKQQEAHQGIRGRFRDITCAVTAGPHELVATFVAACRVRVGRLAEPFNPLGGIGASAAHRRP